jgi:N utilization substance protein A
MEVVVPDDQLSLAIGKRGQNVRLASKVTGWKLDVTSETQYNKDLKDGYKSLLELPGVGEKRASDLYQEGFRSPRDIARAAVGDLVAIDGVSEKRAGKLIQDSIQYNNEETAKESTAQAGDGAEAVDENSDKAVSDAEA